MSPSLGECSGDSTAAIPVRVSVHSAGSELGSQGLPPYRFEIALFVRNEGKLSGRFTATYDVLLIQRPSLQPRLETEFAFQTGDEFGVDAGVNDAEFGIRWRYEVRHEFAPSAGVSRRASFGRRS